MLIDDRDLLGTLGITDFMNALPDEIAVLDSSGRIVLVNDAWRRFAVENDGASDGYVGANYFDVCTAAYGDSSTQAQVILEGLTQALSTGKSFSSEYPCDSPTAKRWFELFATQLTHDGASFLLVQHRNITMRHVQKQTVDAAFISNSAMSALVAGTSDAILTYDLEGRITTWNPAAEKLYGYTSAEAIGQSLEILYPPDWPHPVTYYRDEIIAGRLDRFEATRLAKDGTAREVWISCAPIRGSTGEVVAVSNIHRDVTEIRKIEKARELVAREVVHRAKNMLAIVSAIQRQTARGETSIEGFQKKFAARIRALAKSTDLLANESWTTVALHDLAREHLGPFIEADDPRVRLCGPPVGLPPQAVQAVGMALHELATNSVKYGALTHDAGQIELAWTVSAKGATPVLDITWWERGLAEKTENPTSGFGSSVLTSIASSMLDTRSCHEISDDEVRWGISIPNEHFSPTA